MSDGKDDSKFKDTHVEEEGKDKDGGWDEIDGLFKGKKNLKRQHKQHLEGEQARKRQAVQVENKNQRAMKMSKNSTDDWVNDGLGGVYNSEGFTGRVEDGVKVFKAHILRKRNSGNTPECPFDCDCCFI